MTGNGKNTELLRRKRQAKDDPKRLFRKPAIRRLARRAGVKRIGGLIYAEVRAHGNDFLSTVMARALVFTKHHNRKTVTSQDIHNALLGVGITLYT